MLTSLPIVAAIAVLAQAQGPAQLPPPVRAAADRIVATQLMRDVEYFASDALRGRDTFSPGFDSAAEYIVRRLRVAGLKPMGASGSYRQTYNVKEMALDTAATFVEIGGRRFAYGDDIVVQAFGVEVSVTAPVAYLGHGFRVPSKGIDPYAGTDVKGKIVLVNGGMFPSGLTPGTLPPDAESPFLVAALQGAAALVIIASPRTLSRWDAVRANSSGRPHQELDPPVRSAYAHPATNYILVKPAVAAALLSADSARASRIIGAAPTAELPAPFQLTRGMTVRVVAKTRTTRQSYNILALLEGSDARLKAEYVTVASHLDGAVSTQPVDGDSIYNAADDNASGSAATLAIAEQMARAPRPRRSVLFIWDSGEEVGLWGTRAFVGQKPVPLGDIVAHVNIDMIASTRTAGDTTLKDLADSNEVFITGPRMVSAALDSLVNQANRASSKMRLNFRFDTTTSEFFYPRTDAGPFMERRIPVIEFFTGMHDRYHGPQDEAKYLDPRKLEAISRLAFATLWAVANSPVRPTADKGWPALVPHYR